MVHIVREVGIEPTLDYSNKLLRLARLPIPPFSQIVRLNRLELLRLSTGAFETPSSTNSDTDAYIFVAPAGLEPARPYGPEDFKSAASTYSAIEPYFVGV